MTEETVSQTPAVFSSKERTALVAKALGDAARRARFSTKRRRSAGAGGLRARRGERLMRFLRIASFVTIVLLPSLAAIAYIGFIQSPQYVAEARFTLRGGMPPSLDSIGSLTGAPTMLIVQDTQVIMNYMQSRTMVEALEKSIKFRSLYQSTSIDWLSRLDPDQPIEKIVKYWKAHMGTKVQVPAGIVEFTVQAFTPEESVKVADAALQSSEQLVNQMNDQIKHDSVFLAETERQRAMARVIDTRASLEKARNVEGMLSADAAAAGITALMDTVRGELIKMQQEYDSQRRFVRPDAPQLRNLQTRIDAAQKEIEKLRAQLTTVAPVVSKDTVSQGKTSPLSRDADHASGDVSPDGGGKMDRVISGSMSRLEYAKMENDIAEKIYAGSLIALEHANLASETKLMYLNTFVPPVAPEQARYPKRFQSIGLFVLASLAIWALVQGILQLTRNSFT